MEVLSEGTRSLLGHSTNLSQGGIFIESKNLIKAGTRMILEFKLPNQEGTIRAYGEVKWVTRAKASKSSKRAKPAIGMGVQFINIHETYRKEIARYIESLSNIPNKGHKFE